MTRESADPRPPPSREDEEARLRAIIDHVADGIVIVDGEGTVRFANPAAAEVFGRPLEELVGGAFGFPLVGEGPTEIDIVRRDREARVAELRATEMEWEDRPATLVSLRDVTDRKKAGEREIALIHEQAARWRAEVEERRARLLAEASAVLDSSLDFPGVLEQLARFVVAPNAAIPGRRATEPPLPRMADWCVIDILDADGELERVAVAHHDPAREEVLEEVRRRFPPERGAPHPGARALETRQPQRYGTVDERTLAQLTRGPEHAALIRRAGLASLLALPLVARGETLGVMTLACAEEQYDDAELALGQDLADRAALSIANARLYHEAQRANRAKSDFLATMSHELRTPLNAILGYTDLLAEEITGPLNDAQKQQLERIDDSSRHLLQLVEEILSFARMEAGREDVRAEPVELGELAREVGSMLRPLAERKGLRFRVRTPDAPLEVRTDAAKVRQILLNLLSNAVKFTEQGEVRLEAAMDGTGALLKVADTGVGIAPEYHERIFEPFWQVEQSARRTAGGTGLGLSVARDLAQLLGGRLEVESELDHGTTFTLVLPARPPA